MAAEELEDDNTTAVVEGEGAEGEEPQKLSLDVNIAKPSACERRITVTVSREDIDRYMDNAFSELMPSASVPGFRVGRAPRKIVVQKFKDQIADQVKGSLLMDSLGQVAEDEKFAAISEPDLDLEAVEIPDEGPLTFEFSIEVRPEFDLPKWKGLKLKQPVHKFGPEDIDSQIEQMLAKYGQLVPKDGAAEEGDYLVITLRGLADGKEISKDEERVVRLRKTLSFVDGRVEDFLALAKGAKEGDKLTAEVKLSGSAPNEELRGKPVTLEIEVLEVKQLRLPELDEDFLAEIGGFKTEGDFRDAVQKDLERQLEYEQQKAARAQISEMLTESADWDLPPGLLKRQSVRELERAVMELRRSGFSEGEIRARENELRQNSTAGTAAALKEHFILERIAEEENLDVDQGDFDREIFLISMQSGESPRRVRAQLEKRGLMDVLRNQIIERKVMELVKSEAKFEDQEFTPSKPTVEGVSFAVGGSDGDIPAVVEDEEDDSEG
ncbi:trigger factor [Botrimarina mediterranea]|uniref:Trigger factor n=1 Tax=Botrimarina mediterranea TaxID=2528022 RepID=A0A518K551_9BACT|nr:trigger factor [Botrimarina mediterranea]QDV72923.1 Trigger factor [Botrimarina mediterranea]QDV77496.1 Trigger factor [Planctomycetes bacterium K2D]